MRGTLKLLSKGGLILMKRWFASWAVFAAVAVSSPALGQDFETSSSSVRGQGWSLLSGRTLGTGTDALNLQLGWPGVWFSYLHGMSPKVDLGMRFNLNYGMEGIVDDSIFGMKAQLLGRIQLVDKGKLNVGLTFAPGPLVYFPRNEFFGLAFPVGVVVGIIPTDVVIINAGFELPFWVGFDNGPGLVIPVLMGGGVEYFVDRNLSLSFNLRMGPSIQASSGNAEFTMEALMGLGFRL